MLMVVLPLDIEDELVLYKNSSSKVNVFENGEREREVQKVEANIKAKEPTPIGETTMGGVMRLRVNTGLSLSNSGRIHSKVIGAELTLHTDSTVSG